MDWMLEDGQVICVTGSIPQLGMWQPDQMLLLTGGVSAAAKLERSPVLLQPNWKGHQDYATAANPPSMLHVCAVGPAPFFKLLVTIAAHQCLSQARFMPSGWL
jgi:hypothetical protein